MSDATVAGGSKGDQPDSVVIGGSVAKLHCPECGAGSNEWCDSTCTEHRSGTCGLPHPSAPDGSRPWVATEIDENAFLIERLGVTCIDFKFGASNPGVVPTGFVALVEVVDGAGDRHLVKVTSTGASDERVARWLGEHSP